MTPIEKLQKLAEQLKPIMEADKKELLDRVVPLQDIIDKCRFRLNVSESFATETWSSGIEVHYRWEVYGPGKVLMIVGRKTNRKEHARFTPQELPCSLARRAIDALDGFIEQYTELVKDKLAALASYS